MVDAVLLDLNLPGMSGYEFLEKIKAIDTFQSLPVIIQTGDTSPASIQKGIDLGAYYYLTKPVQRKVLISIVEEAVKHARMLTQLEQQRDNALSCMALTTRLEFAFRTVEDVKALSAYLSSFYPDPAKVSTGIWELLLNAVEHGNLGISYAEKSALMESGEWAGEIERRLASPEYQDRVAHGCLIRGERSWILEVTDQGAGFNWQKYMTFDPERAFDLHGRGIATANGFSFTKVEYLGNGSQVRALLEW
ncbi:response regulator [Maribrevibacterium harenarium]|uniref:Response regulator n=1 Tax=Maribrevibacterium harenarium TaxID=2589817 RepID=A0A501W7T9_9GAMM|nr:response regulator [Maribrevibacterium harenarium]TPE44595.1 response regulator [Maribrevibacterium harenarium]